MASRTIGLLARPGSPAGSRRWREPAAILGIGLIGVLLLGSGYLIFLLAAIVFAGALAVGALNWRWSIYGLILYLPVAGLAVIALYPHTQPGVLAKDVFFVIPAYVGYFGERILRRRGRPTVGAPTIALGALALLVLLQTFNPALPNALVGLIGLKVYLLYTPLVYVGYQLVETKADLFRLVRVLALSAVLPCTVGLVEAIFIYGGHASAVYALYGAAAGPATQGFFVYNLGTPGANLHRIPSTFSYVAQFYLFTIAMIAMAYAWLRGPLRGTSTAWLGTALLILVALASLLTGSRGAFFFVPIMFALLLLLDRVGGMRAALILGAVAVAFFAALTVIGSGLGSTLTRAGVDGSANGGLIFSWVPRALHLTKLGLGAGIDTGAARYAFPSGQAGPAVFQAIGGVWLETWWVKVMVELGLFGVVTMVVLLGQMVGGGILRQLRIRDPELRSVGAAFLAVVIWNVLYLVKSQNIDLDPMNVYFWLFAGVAARCYTLDLELRAVPRRSGEPPVLQAGEARRMTEPLVPAEA